MEPTDVPGLLLDGAPDAIVVSCPDGTITMANRRAHEMFGYPAHDLVGRCVDDLVPGERRTDARLSGFRRDGSTFPVEVSLAELDGPDGETYLTAVLRDITDQLAAEEERRRLREEAERQRLEARIQQTQRLESLGQLAGGIAHDFNNLLAVILNYASFIVEDATGTASAADAEQIARAARRGSDLTHQLLAFARREVIRPRPLNLNTVVTEVHQMLERSLGEHIALTVRTTASLPSVMADPGQLEQVLVNLAVNARDAMPTGGRLTIDTALVEVDADHAAGRAGLPIGRYVRLRVSDTGTGMPKDVIDKAFEPFFTTKPSGQGTGLGLATVYGIITQAGGTVQIYSENGIGTTFTLLLPVTDAEAAAFVPDDSAAGLAGHGATVLVVEDESALREVTCRILTRGGYTVLAADGGEEALRVAAGHSIDVLLTDVIMPNMLGKDLADAVRSRWPGTKVLFMSGYAQPVLTTHGTLSADVHLLEKPFTSAELMRALHDEIQAKP